jgi:DHA1 family tetracycline resistance protein-like MFS transporter
VAGGLALANLLYGYFVLPESLAKDHRKPFRWKAANPVAALSTLRQLHGVGRLVAVVACAGLAQFVLHTSWVLYTTFKFGWGPQENGWSLAMVGAVSVLVQGFLLKHLLLRFTPQRLATVGLVGSTLTYFGFGAASEGWMLFVIIVVGNLIAGGAQAAIQSLVSNAADASSQGQTMGAVASLNSLTAVFAPVISATLLGFVSHRPQGDWLIGMPFYFCAALQFTGTLVALWHFRHHPGRPAAAA